MRDPFKPHTNHQLVREAQFGFSVIGLLVATLIYVAWFRLNGIDRLPDDVRSSPIAMQVYPNSPNYDSDSHQMIAPNATPNKFIDSKPVLPANSRRNPLSEVPRKIMADSQRSARRLSQDATSIDRSVTKVASLLKPTRSTSPAPESLLAVEPIKEIEAAPRFESTSAGSRKGDLLPSPTKIQSPVGIPASALPAVEKTNDFKAIAPNSDTPTRQTSSDLKQRLFSPFKSAAASAPERASTRASRPSLAPQKLTPQALPTLRPTAPTPQPRQPLKTSQVFKANAAVKTPAVQTVSFESTTWKVKQGDSFWSIAQASYGDGRFFRALYESNRKRVPGFENLREDVEIDIPSEEQLLSQHPLLCPADAVHRNDPWRATPDDLMEDLTDNCDTELQERFYETKTKDTLFHIAQRQLGQASRYVELLELNRFRIPADSDHQTLLPTGIQLLLPNQ